MKNLHSACSLVSLTAERVCGMKKRIHHPDSPCLGNRFERESRGSLKVVVV